MSNILDPKVWGPRFWFMMQATAAGYPSTPTSLDRKHYKDHFASLIYTLPCGKCRDNYKRLFDRYPIDGYLNSNTQLSEWVEIIKKATDSEIKNNGNCDCHNKQTYVPIERMMQKKVELAPCACSAKPAGCSYCHQSKAQTGTTCLYGHKH